MSQGVKRTMNMINVARNNILDMRLQTIIYFYTKIRNEDLNILKREYMRTRPASRLIVL